MRGTQVNPRLYAHGFQKKGVSRTEKRHRSGGSQAVAHHEDLLNRDHRQPHWGLRTDLQALDRMAYLIRSTPKGVRQSQVTPPYPALARMRQDKKLLLRGKRSVREDRLTNTARQTAQVRRLI